MCRQLTVTTIILSFIAVLFSCNNNTIQTTQLSQKQLDSLKNIECDSLLTIMRNTHTDQIKKISNIPADFNGCLNQLDTILTDKMKEWIRCLPDKEFGDKSHMGFGTYLRNKWELWNDTSKLRISLFKMGVLHPDDMTGIIFDSYQRKIKGEDIRLSEQLKYYQDFWRRSGMPVDSILLDIKNKKEK